MSAQKYADTVITAAEAFGVSPSAVSPKLVGLTAQKLKAFQERSLVAFTPFAIFLDTIHRGGEAFLVALGVDVSGQKMAVGFWQGSSENHEICEAQFRDLERRGLALSRRILFVTDGGSGLFKALRERFGKKLVPQRCAIHNSRNLQRHVAKPYRIHRLKVPARLRKTLMSTNPIESMFSLVRHSERNMTRTRGSAMLQRWLGTVLLYCERQFRRVKSVAGIAQVPATIEAEHAEPQSTPTKKAA